MRIHILGICGTFMGGLALLARQAGHEVSGSDHHVYPPMSEQLRRHGIGLTQGYTAAALEPEPDMVVIGNALSRGNAAVEYVLRQGIAYTSGPQWLAQQVLHGRQVLAVAGTHGKTTVTALLAWILECAGLRPGYLIGGVPEDLPASAALGAPPFFVLEADEYDTAFFDKRAKFIHYRPNTLVLNNLEYDHADIYPDLAAIETQFHHLLRTVPDNGRVIYNLDSAALRRVLDRGCWSPCEGFSEHGDGWGRRDAGKSPDEFIVTRAGRDLGATTLALPGRHNQLNTVAAIAAAAAVGVPPATALAAVGRFKGVKRRMQLRGEANGVRVYDDFAHHPTAIECALNGLRGRANGGRVLTVLEPRSNTMRLGVHRKRLPAALRAADRVYLYTPPALGWDAQAALAPLGAAAFCHRDLSEMVRQVAREARAGDHILVMSNGGFADVHSKILAALQ